MAWAGVAPIAWAVTEDEEELDALGFVVVDVVAFDVGVATAGIEVFVAPTGPTVDVAVVDWPIEGEDVGRNGDEPIVLVPAAGPDADALAPGTSGARWASRLA